MNSSFRRLFALCLVTLLLHPGTLLRAADDKKERKDEDVIMLTPFEVGAAASGSLGATVGGAKDARYARAAAKRGELPDPSTITAEGLFAEHDLPLKLRQKNSELFMVNGEAMPARLLTKPEVRYLAQIGLSSGLNAATWHREPLNLIAVVDKSGSMNGEPLELVKRSLHQVLAQLGEDDQLGIVLYGDRAHVFLEPTAATAENRERLDNAIDRIASAGSTNMEAGLRVGFELARRSAKTFSGRTRVMQFTDERPNVGATDADSFMGMMEAASHDGIGQTTIGVGVAFDPALAATISAVRGGNLFYFPDANAMVKTFTEDLDTMVTELAYDLELKVTPAPGLRLVEVYGIPGEMVDWTDERRTMRFHLSTVFLSKRKGAIYLAFAPAEDEDDDDAVAAPKIGASLAKLSLSYRLHADGEPRMAKLDLPLMHAREASVGLTRGRLLVNEFVGLRAALAAQQEENDVAKAQRLAKKLHTMFQADADRSLSQERKLVARVHRTLVDLAKHETRDEDDDEAFDRRGRLE